MYKFFTSAYPGLVVMVAGLVIEAFASGWYAYLAGSLWAISALFAENHELKNKLQPKLRMVFDQDRGAPFVRDKPLQAETLRIFNVGMVNDGADTAGSVSVRLTKIEPPELEPYWTSKLHVANEDTAVSERDIHKAPKPVVFYEVVSQVFDGHNPTKSLRVRFAGDSLFERTLTLRDKYFLTLAIDGAGAGQAQRFVVQRNTDGQYEMRPALYPAD